MNKMTNLPNGNTLTIMSVAGGSFTTVVERRPDHSLVVSRTVMSQSVAERLYTERGGK